MKRTKDGVLYSASDLLDFMACSHHTTLSLIDLEAPMPRAADDGQLALIQDKGDDHESNYLSELRGSVDSVVEIPTEGDLAVRVNATREAMREGAQVIYQAAFASGSLMGYADFLRRVARPSDLGDYSYEVIDTKLARSPKAKFAIQLCFYSKLLSDAQGCEPERAAIVLGDGREIEIRLPDYRYYFEELLARFLDHCAQTPETRPEPCSYCDQCAWREHCQAQWQAEDHLTFVAGIQRGQIDKLRAAGVQTLEQLAKLPASSSIPRLAEATLDNLRNQARLQYQARIEGQPIAENLALDSDAKRGFYRLPAPSSGDLFFDMEGDPLEANGLEYLFGVRYREAGQARFRAFWAHDRDEERISFEAFMDFVTARLHDYPDAHIYHYAHYEATALKRLMSLHGTREARVDNLLRQEKLVDLYRVVREAVRISEPAYSIKNLEVFYRDAREGDVKNAGASIVAYEQWRLTGDAVLLEEIEAYNRVDCESTEQLRDWLLARRPAELPFRATVQSGADSEPTAVGRQEELLAEYRPRLAVDRSDHADGELKQLTFQLLDFHRRNDKPVWWAMFARHEMTEPELLEDVECVAGLIEASDRPREQVRTSEIVTYRFPEQEYKAKIGQSFKIAVTLEPAGELVEIDHGGRWLRLKRGTRKYGALPDRLTIIPGGPIAQEQQRLALYRIADSMIAGDEQFAAVKMLLRREAPTLQNHTCGQPLIAEEEVNPQAVGDVVARLRESYLFIQGPPGAGKTYTGSYVIVDLIRRGFRIGVTSNSHKAIHNLLDGIERWATRERVCFVGVKKASRQNPDSYYDGTFIHSAESNDDAIAMLLGRAALIAGTSWLFSGKDLDGELDYLFVDEAGQVALANLTAMGTSARNLVLLGDQMQLGQPIQGIHPGHSGESSLEYLLAGRATVPPDRGIFLPDTYRMHPAVTRFISDAIYDARLNAAPGNENQRLVSTNDLDVSLRQPGIRVLEVVSEGCSQRNEAEAETIRSTYQSLIGSEFIDRSGSRGRLSEKNILVVAPYNMQVNLLQEVLGEHARVGTVDRFQGQEAEIVFVSMATSSQEYLPRHLDFLFSRNRLNVAISRARIMAVVVISPALTLIECNTLGQMHLVNTLCWAKAYASN